MSTLPTPRTRYRMPAVFGPAPGPRQKADGSQWQLEETGTMRQQWLKIDVLTRPEQLERLLPPGFSLRGEPVLTVELGYFRDLYWLAGRSYGIHTCHIPVTYTGREETVDGEFMPVIWEGLADAIITGRDELGFPKLVADFPEEFELDLDAGTVAGSASWLDHTFVELEITGLTEDENAVMAPPVPNLTFKYVPRTSIDGSGGADVASVTVLGYETNQALPQAALTPTGFRRWTGTGSFRWNRAKFEQQPTTFHVINALADIDVLEVRSAEMIEFSLPGIAISGNGQRTIEPAEDHRFARFPR